MTTAYDPKDLFAALWEFYQIHPWIWQVVVCVVVVWVSFWYFRWRIRQEYKRQFKDMNQSLDYQSRVLSERLERLEKRDPGTLRIRVSTPQEADMVRKALGKQAKVTITQSRRHKTAVMPPTSYDRILQNDDEGEEPPDGGPTGQT